MEAGAGAAGRKDGGEEHEEAGEEGSEEESEEKSENESEESGDDIEDAAGQDSRWSCACGCGRAVQYLSEWKALFDAALRPMELRLTGNSGDSPLRELPDAVWGLVGELANLHTLVLRSCRELKTLPHGAALAGAARVPHAGGCQTRSGRSRAWRSWIWATAPC